MHNALEQTNVKTSPFWCSFLLGIKFSMEFFECTSWKNCCSCNTFKPVATHFDALSLFSQQMERLPTSWFCLFPPIFDFSQLLRFTFFLFFCRFTIYLNAENHVYEDFRRMEAFPGCSGHQGSFPHPFKP